MKRDRALLESGFSITIQQQRGRASDFLSLLFETLKESGLKPGVHFRLFSKRASHRIVGLREKAEEIITAVISVYEQFVPSPENSMPA